MVENAATQRCRGKHAFDERLEFYVPMVEGFRDRPGELDLVGLEPVNRLARFFSSVVVLTRISRSSRLRLASLCPPAGQSWDLDADSNYKGQ